MEILGVKWFTNMKEIVGVVLYKDKQGEERAGISYVDGIDEERDIEFIVMGGAKFPVDAAKKLIPGELTTENSPRVKEQLDAKIRDVTADMEKR